jgi:hypothetical protein
LKARIAAPGESTAEFDAIARRFIKGTQAFAGTAGEKRALLPPKSAAEQKKAANSEEFAAIIVLQAPQNRLPKRGANGRQCATRP